MTDNEIVGEKVRIQRTRLEFWSKDYPESGVTATTIAKEQEHLDLLLAIQDVLELLNRKPVPHVQRIEYQMRMKPINDFKDELRQAITNRIGGK